jgi:hypothetical protein
MPTFGRVTICVKWATACCTSVSIVRRSSSSSRSFALFQGDLAVSADGTIVSVMLAYNAADGSLDKV